jgi:hypothetical protein
LWFDGGCNAQAAEVPVDFAAKAGCYNRSRLFQRLVLTVRLLLSGAELAMHFLLVLLRMVLDRLIPGWQDGLTMAARADGRVEHLPTGPSLWDRWLDFARHYDPRVRRAEKKPRLRGDAARRRQ